VGSDARSVEVVVLGTAGSTPACVVLAAVVEEAVVVVDCAAGVTTVTPAFLIPCAVAEAAAGLTAKAAEVKLAAAAVTKLVLLLDPAAVPITAP
jgi:hypothetical protein